MAKREAMSEKSQKQKLLIHKIVPALARERTCRDLSIMSPKSSKQSLNHLRRGARCVQKQTLDLISLKSEHEP
jgi:hypothetical protein